MQNGKLFLLLAIVITFSLLMGCSDASPAIDQTQIWRILTLDSKTRKTSQQLSVLSAFRFSDGAKNLQSMYILNDNLQILWHLEGPSLQSFEHFDRHWVGNANLALAPGEPVPIGRFRILLYDRAGHKALSEASLTHPSNDPEGMMPTIQHNGMEIKITPPLIADRMVRELIMLDWAGAEIKRFKVQKDLIDLSEAVEGRKENEYRLWLVDTWQDENLILRSGPW